MRAFVIKRGTNEFSPIGPWSPPAPWPSDVEALGDGMNYHRAERVLRDGEVVFLYVAMAENGSKRAARRLRAAGVALPWSADQDEEQTI